MSLPKTRRHRSQGRNFLHGRPHRTAHQWRIINFLLKSVTGPRSADLERVCVCVCVPCGIPIRPYVGSLSPLSPYHWPICRRLTDNGPPCYKASTSCPKERELVHLALLSRGNRDWVLRLFHFLLNGKKPVLLLAAVDYMDSPAQAQAPSPNKLSIACYFIFMGHAINTRTVFMHAAGACACPLPLPRTSGNSLVGQLTFPRFVFSQDAVFLPSGGHPCCIRPFLCLVAGEQPPNQRVFPSRTRNTHNPSPHFHPSDQRRMWVLTCGNFFLLYIHMAYHHSFALPAR